MTKLPGMALLILLYQYSTQKPDWCTISNYCAILHNHKNIKRAQSLESIYGHGANM